MKSHLLNYSQSKHELINNSEYIQFRHMSSPLTKQMLFSNEDLENLNCKTSRFLDHDLEIVEKTEHIAKSCNLDQINDKNLESNNLIILQNELKRLKQQNIFLCQDRDKQLCILRNQLHDLTIEKSELEKKNLWLENELKNTQFDKLNIHYQRKSNNHTLSTILDPELPEKNILENESIKPGMINQNIESEINEKLRIIKEYEIKIIHLKDELRFLTQQRNFNKTINFNKLQDESNNCSFEVLDLDPTIKVLNNQVEKLKTISYFNDLNEKNLLAIEQQNSECLRNDLKSKDDEIIMMQEEFQMVLKQKFTEINELKRQLTLKNESDIKIILMSIEIERLHGIITDKCVEIETWKNQMNNLQKVHDHMFEELQLKFEDHFKKTMNFEMDDIQSRYQADKDIFNTTIKSMSMKICDLEKKIRIVSEDYEQLQIAYNVKIKELDSWKKKYTSLEGANNEYESIKGAIGDIMVIHDNIRVLSEKNGEFENTINQQKTMIAQLENRFVLCSVEIKRLEMIVAEKDEQIQILKEKYDVPMKNHANYQAQDTSSVDEKMPKCTKENMLKESGEIPNSYQNTIENLKCAYCHKLTHHQYNISNPLCEIQKFPNLSNQQANDLEVIKLPNIQSDNNQETMKFHIRNDTVSSLEMELINLETKSHINQSAIDTQITKLKAKIIDLENHLVLNFIEIERLGLLYQEKTQENEKLEEKNLKIEQDYRKIVETILSSLENNYNNRLTQEIKEITGKFSAEKELLNTMIRILEQKLEEANNKLKNSKPINEKNVLHEIELENGRKSMIKDKNLKENIQFGGEMDLKAKMENETKQLQAKWLAEKAILDIQLKNYRNRVEELENKKYDLENELEKIRKNLTDKLSEIEILRNESQELKTQTNSIQEKENEIEDWKKKYEQLEKRNTKEIEDLKQQFENVLKCKLDFELKDQANKWIADRTRLDTQIKQDHQFIIELEKKISFLEADVAKLTQYNHEKHSEIEELKAEIASMLEKENEVETWKERYQLLKENHYTELVNAKAQLEYLIQQKLEFWCRELQNNHQNECIKLANQINNNINNQNEYMSIYELNLTNINLENLNPNQISQSYDPNQNHNCDADDDSINHINQLKHEIDTNINQILEKNSINLIKHFNLDHSLLDNALMKKKKYYEDLELKNILFIIEIARLNSLSYNLGSQESCDMNEQYTKVNNSDDLDSQNRIVSEFKVDLESTKGENKWNNEKPNLENSITIHQAKIMELEHSLELIQNENIRLDTELADKIRQIHEYKLIAEKYEEAYLQQIQEDCTDRQTKLNQELDAEINEIKSKFSNERTGYENQIRDFKVKILDNENKTGLLMKELEKLRQDLFEKSTEVEAWRSRYIILEKNHGINCDDLEGKSEKSQKNDFEHKIRDFENKIISERNQMDHQMKLQKQKNIDLENRNTLLISEIEKLNKSIFEKMAEIDNWKMKYTHIERQHNTQIQELYHQFEIKKREEVEMLNKQWNAKLLEEKSIYEIQIKNLKKKANAQENKFNQHIDEMNKSSYELESKTNEVDNIKDHMQHYNVLDKKNYLERGQIEASKQKKRIVDHEKTLNHTIFEIEILKQQLEEKNKEIENLNMQLQTISSTKNQEIYEFFMQNEGIKQNILLNQNLQVQFNAEKAAYETQIIQLKQRITELETIISDKTKEMQKFNNLYTGQVRELDKFKLKTCNTEDEFSHELNHLKKELEFYKRMNSDAREIMNKHESNKKELMSQINILKHALENTKIQIIDLQNQVIELKQDKDILSNQLNNSDQENLKLRKDIKIMENDLILSTKNTENFKKEIEEMTRSRDIFKNQYDKNNTEIVRKNKELMDKIQDVEILKRKYEEAIAIVHPIQNLSNTKVITKSTNNLHSKRNMM